MPKRRMGVHGGCGSHPEVAGGCWEGQGGRQGACQDKLPGLSGQEEAMLLASHSCDAGGNEEAEAGDERAGRKRGSGAEGQEGQVEGQGRHGRGSEGSRSRREEVVDAGEDGGSQAGLAEAGGIQWELASEKELLYHQVQVTVEVVQQMRRQTELLERVAVAVEELVGKGKE